MLRDGRSERQSRKRRNGERLRGLHLRDLLLDGHLAKQVGDPFISRIRRILVDGGAVGLTGGSADDRCVSTTGDETGWEEDKGSHSLSTGNQLAWTRLKAKTR